MPRSPHAARPRPPNDLAHGTILQQIGVLVFGYLASSSFAPPSTPRAMAWRPQVFLVTTNVCKGGRWTRTSYFTKPLTQGFYQWFKNRRPAGEPFSYDDGIFSLKCFIPLFSGWEAFNWNCSWWSVQLEKHPWFRMLCQCSEYLENWMCRRGVEWICCND